MNNSFLKLKRSEKTLELMKHWKEFMLLCLISYRARRTDCEISGLRVGQAQVGDHKSAGLTRQNYRTALKNLEKWKFLTTDPTNNGTVATLINSDVWDINAEELTTRLIKRQPTGNQRATTNKKDKKDKKIMKENTLSSDFEVENHASELLDFEITEKERQELLKKRERKANAEKTIAETKALRIPEKVVALYHEHAPLAPKVRALTTERRADILTRFKQYDRKLLHFEILFRKAGESNFLSGRTGRAAFGFDWILKPKNMIKTLEGYYDNDRQTPRPRS